jgi:hypothetical protein
MSVRITALAALCALTLSSAATAQEDYDRPGPYLGLAGTLAVPAKLENDLEKDVQVSLPDATLEVDPSLGLNARAGYRFHPRFAAELRYEWLSGYQTKIEGTGGSATVGDLGGWALTGDAKVYLPGDRAQVFFLMGIGAVNLQSDDLNVDGTVFATRWGLGLDVYATPHVAFTLDASYVLPVSETGGVRADYLSVGWGLMYRF